MPATWAEDYKRLCAQPDSEEACTFAGYFQGLVQSPVKSLELYGQIGIVGRFQEYVDDFSADNQEGKLVEPGLGSIS